MANEEVPDDTLLMTGGALAGSFGDGVAERLDDIAGVPAGTLLGPYRVLSELGRGGMGLVLLAERADGEFEQRLAIKLLKRGTDTDEVLRRFRQERQILASLNHPNIARLLDGGVAADGRPFFAMELVDGEPLDRYCARRDLPVDDRLALFVTVARAVDHAHRALIVHRDLKPSNILVTESGEVKLLDFGIARLVGSEGDPGLTLPSMRIMTLQYASPEQIRGEPVTTSSDVYQLGLLLFELLTGRPAYRVGPGGRTELARAICEDPTPAPGAVTGRRFGDLDSITTMALRKDPMRRYTSVEQLIDDVVRYRSCRPVQARPDSIAYRASTLARRHPIAVASTLAAAVVLGLTVIFYTARLAAERDRAQLEARKAAQVASFLRGIFEVSDPALSKGADITARELLDRGAQRVQTDLAGQPVLQAEMLSITGDIFTKLGAFDRAEPLLRRALDLQIGERGDDALEAADARTLLALVYRAKNDEPQAEPLLRSALTIRERVRGPNHPDVARTLLHLASLTMAVPREEREGLIVRARAIQEQTMGPAHVDLASTDEQLAVLYWTIGRYKDMLPLYERALAIRERAQGSDHPDVAGTFLGIGSVYRRIGDPDRAETALVRALSIQERSLGPDHPTTGWTVNNLAGLYNDGARDELAEKMYRRYLSIAERSFGGNHNQTAIALGNVGDFYISRGRISEAAPLIERALAIQESVHGPSHPNVAWALGLLGGLRHAQARYDAAEKLYHRALGIRQAHSGPESPAAALCLVGLASAQAAMGRHREAEPSFKRGLAIREQALGPLHPDVIFTIRAYAASLRALAREEEAEALERRIPPTK